MFRRNCLRSIPLVIRDMAGSRGNIMLLSKNAFE